MTEKEKKFLSDRSHSIELIEHDLKTKGAVERHLGIIGEAVNKFLRESKSNSLENASQIISLRNRLIHSYDKIDDSIIWSILTRHLPLLQNEVAKKMGQAKD